MVQQLDLPPQLLHSLQRILIPQPLRLLLIHQHKIMFQHLAPLLNPVLLRNSRICRAKVDYQRFLDAEDRIRGLVGIVADIERAEEGTLVLC